MGHSRMRLLTALAAVMLWSTNAYAAGAALDRITLGWLLLVQYGTAAAVLLAVRTLRHARRTAPSTAPSTRPAAVARRVGPPAAGSTPLAARAVLIGVVGLTGTIFLQYAAFAIAPIVAANVLAYGWPLLAAVWVAATRRDRQALLAAALAVVGFGGVALIFTDAPSSDLTAGGGATWGYLAALGSAACMATYTLGATRITTSTTGLLVPATLTGTAAAAVLVIVADNPPPAGTGVLVAAYIGLGPMAAGYALWAAGMAHGGAERLAPLGYATPLLSTILLLATGAPATTSTLAGVGLVLICSLGVLAHHRYTNQQEDQHGTQLQQHRPTTTH